MTAAATTPVAGRSTGLSAVGIGSSMPVSAPAEGAATGVRQAGKSSKVEIVGFDAEPDEITALQPGTVQALIAQSPNTIGGQSGSDLQDKLLTWAPVYSEANGPPVNGGPFVARAASLASAEPSLQSLEQAPSGGSSMTTMRDVARVAGVSAKTVSRVFNEDPHVTEETRERVRWAMQKLNYIPNLLARSFRAGAAWRSW